MEDKINQFLQFRKMFTKREWFEINAAIELREKEKADKLELDDFDIKTIKDRLLTRLFE